MLVVAVGEHSQKGKISALLDTPNEDTPLTKKLEHLANRKFYYPNLLNRC
jgi:magnesium-transporting ATPase (P-type)